MSVITISNCTKKYGDTTVVDSLDLSVDSGEIYGFLGPNGAGKTTTIKMATGLVTPSNGEIEVKGHDPVSSGKEVRAEIGILPEKESPMDYQTPREYLHFTGMTRGIDENVIEDRIAAWAEKLSFTDKLDTLSTDLSRGQQQKVMITQAFIHQPELVIIDEPLANLDPVMQERVKDYIVEYAESGNTIFLSTHQISVAEEICTRTGILDEGELVAECSPSELDEDEKLIDMFESHIDPVIGEDQG